MEREREREHLSEPPLLACRALMNANHDPEAARSTCCFPVQIAYNFYCHGRNSSLMEARLISVLVLRPSRVSCVLLPSPRSSPPHHHHHHHHHTSSLLHPRRRPLPLACRSARFLTPLIPAYPRATLASLRRLRFRFPISFSILLDQRHRALCRSHIRRI